MIQDEHAAHVQLHAASLVAIHLQIKRWLRRNVDNRLELIRRIQRQVQPGQRLVLDKATAQLFVEVLVLVLGDFRGALGPQRGAAVALLATEAHRPLHVV